MNTIPRKRFKLLPLITGLSLAGIGAIWVLAGITDIDPGEIGLMIKKVGSNRGIQKETLDTGLHWVEPITYDVVIYDGRSQQYDEFHDLPSSTADGQPVSVDLSLEIWLEDSKVPYLHENIGKAYFEKVVYPATRSAIRNKIPSKSSDEVYTQLGREGIQTEINEFLNNKLNVNGIHVATNLRKIEFLNDDFKNTLEEKAKAGQEIIIQERRADAAKEEAKRVANIAEGQKQRVIKESEAVREQMRLSGEGERLKKEEQAKGILAIAQAEAEGIRLRNEALSGPGGDRQVSIAWAENMGPNVKVWGIPTGSPGTTSVMDLNGILQGAFKGKTE